jgi:hypothetical protein
MKSLLEHNPPSAMGLLLLLLLLHCAAENRHTKTARVVAEQL